MRNAASAIKSITRRLKLSARPALVHVAVSAFIASLSMALIFLVWYPAPLSQLQGVDRLVLIMIGVDIAIGPLITLVIFDPAKKWLWIDLTVIAALQMTALLYGLQTIYNGRPAYVVFNVARFDVVAIAEIDRDSLGKANQAMQPSYWGPLTVAAPMPEDPKVRNDILFSALAGGPDLPQLPEYFVPLEEARSTMLARLRPMDELRKLNEMEDSKWTALLSKIGGSASARMGYLPVVGNATDGAMILDSESGRVLGMLALTPSFDPLEARP